MYKILDHCFGSMDRIDLLQFKQITEEKSSDMVLAVLSLFRERLPCSENYWRYKRNYELHMQILCNDIKQRSISPQHLPDQLVKYIEEESKSDDGQKKVIAQAHMSFCKPLSPYSRGGRFFNGGQSPRSEDSVGSGPNDVVGVQDAIASA